MTWLASNPGAAEACPRCRKRLLPQAVFCPRCGIRLRAAPVASMMPPVIPTVFARGIPRSINQRTLPYATPQPKQKAVCAKSGSGSFVWVVIAMCFFGSRFFSAFDRHRSTPPAPVVTYPNYTPAPINLPSPRVPNYTPPSVTWPAPVTPNPPRVRRFEPNSPPEWHYAPDAYQPYNRQYSPSRAPSVPTR
jgi:hypothetical protein